MFISNLIYSDIPSIGASLDKKIEVKLFHQSSDCDLINFFGASL